MNSVVNQSGTDTTGESLLERSLLFRRWQVMKQEILLHKWYESERAGYDIGWERASTNWMMHHSRHCPAANTTEPSARA
jgi:hypothetical protein